MSFTKFASLLLKESLYFARADKFDDPFEGSYSRFNIINIPNIYKKIPGEKLKELSKFYKDTREHTYINCWHLNQYESAAMWNLYLKSNEGIAIQSTFERLVKSFQKCIDHEIYIGKIKYIDYDKDWLPEGNFFYPFVHKRLSFAHEQEIRAIIYYNPSDGEKLELGITKSSHGLYIPIDIKIYVAPMSPEWFSNLVRSITNHYKLNKEVIKSSLSDDPVF